MEQLNNSLLNIGQSQTAAKAVSQTGDKGARTEESSFQKMLEENQAAGGQTSETQSQTGAETQQTAEAVQQEPDAADDTDIELQKQIALASLMAGMQRAVMPEIQQEAELVTEAAPAVMAAEGAAEEILQQADIGVKDVQTPVQKAEGPDMLPETAGTEAAPQQAEEIQAPEIKPVENDAAGNDGVAEEKRPEAELTAVERGVTQRADEDKQQVEYGGERPVFHEVRDIPVKVGETEAPAQMEAMVKPLETQVGDKLIQTLQSGETKVEIQLEPESLGKIQVEMTWDKEGALHVSMFAESSHTRSMLERDVSGLQSLLGRSTQQEVHVEVLRQQESQQQGFYDGREGGHQQHQQQEHRQNHSRQRGEDFLHQLRLGLVGPAGETF